MPYKTLIKRREASRECSRRWRKNHPEYRAEYYATYIKDHYDKYLKSQQKHYYKTKDAAFEKLGNRCSNLDCCWANDDGSRGCVDTRCLQIDHVSGQGNSERKLGIASLKMYKAVLKDTTGKYQLLCANCNWIKRVERSETRTSKDGGR